MTAYVARITASDSEILDDLRSLARAIERGDITTAPGEGRSPLTRALMYVEDTTGWDAWTCSYVGGESDDEVVSDIESATRYPNWRDAMEAGMYRREFGETVDVLPVDEYTATPEEPCATCGATDTILCDSCGHWYCREHEAERCPSAP